MTSPRLIAVGAIFTTSLYRVPRVPPPPAKVLASAMRQVVDGMAISAACAFQRLGGTAAVWSRVGEDAAAEAMRLALTAEGLDASGLHTVPGSFSAQSTVLLDDAGERLVVPFFDPDVDPSADWLPLALLDHADFLHCDPRWVEGAEAAMRAARARSLPAMLDGDVAPAAVLDRLVPLATHVVFSDAGLLAYTHRDDVGQALREVARHHHGHIGASCGRRGYVWLEEGQLRHVPAPVVDVVDTLAAGDVFHGALALALAEGQPVDAAARFACVAASLKCTRFGGRLGCPTREEVLRFERDSAADGLD
ncbi:MAG: PfkB family carbohydrate kinase [Pseudomonadota bacterium]